MKNVLQKLTVLFLEDSEQDIEITYQKLIDEFDCPVRMDTAHNESMFLDLIRHNQYDVILADYTLPGYNAAAALEKALQICPNTPFIFVSGTIGEDIAVEMLKQGATDYVIKDRLERLPFAIRRAIEGRVLAQEKLIAEQKIKELSESSRLILDSTSDGIGMLDREYNILNINEIFAHQLGYAVAEAIGMNFKALFQGGKFRECYKQRLQRFSHVFETGQPEIFDDICEKMWFHNRVYPVFKEGQVAAITLFSTDITDKVHAEEKAQKNALLNKEAEVLRQADRNKSRFLNVLSHELRNPLATIVMAQALLRQVPPDSEKAKRTQAMLERQTAILTRMVDDLLDVTRINENKVQLKLERLDLVELVNQTASDICPAYDDKGINLRIELPAGSICVKGDRVRLAQSIGNLLHNGLKFSQPGSTVAIAVALDADQKEVMVHVKDQGAGLETEALEHIFQPFTQVDQTLARTKSGLGLGLSIVRGMVELHGGHVEAESEGLGKGATFTIHLPLR